MADRMQQEREAFERFVLSEGIAVAEALTRDGRGYYHFSDIRAAWLGWAARAAYGVPASVPCCPPGEPHDFSCPNGVAVDRHQTFCTKTPMDSDKG